MRGDRRAVKKRLQKPIGLMRIEVLIGTSPLLSEGTGTVLKLTSIIACNMVSVNGNII